MFRLFKDRHFILVGMITLLMLGYFLSAHPALNDDGFHYEGFAESAARGKIDFKNFYGFQGLSFLAVPIFWLTHSNISIIIASIILWLLSLPLAYAIGRKYYDSRRAGLIFTALLLLMPYPYTTMMRGFQEAALLFFVLLVIYGSISQKKWAPLAWTAGGVVKPFALTLLPLWIKKSSFRGSGLAWLLVAAALAGLYLGTSYWQTGHLINNAAINSYEGHFDTGNPPPLQESFVFGWKGFARAAANLLVVSRKILISPLVILLGLGWWWKNKSLLLRREIFLAILLNILLVGSLTFSFQKYLLPMTTLLILMAAPLIARSRLIQILVLVDSFLVFKPIYDYFGHNFWPNFAVYLFPLLLAGVIFVIINFIKKEIPDKVRETANS